MAEDKFSQRRESSRNMKVARNQKAVATNFLEAIAQLSRSGGGAAAADGPMRMKIVMKREELEQVLEAIRDGRGSFVRRGPVSAAAAPSSLEQRLSLLRRRQILRAAAQAKGRSRPGSWRPVLQSIPE